jgi:hypothetical protein
VYLKHTTEKKALLLDSLQELATYRAAQLATAQLVKQKDDAERVLDHDPTEIPDFVSPDLLSSDALTTGGKVLGFVTRWFKAVHTDPDHPEYWNIVLYNSKSLRLRVRNGGSWRDSSFHDWADAYAGAVIVMCINHVFPATASDHYPRVLRIMDDMKSEIREGLKSALLQPDFRRAAKRRFGMR